MSRWRFEAVFRGAARALRQGGRRGRERTIILVLDNAGWHTEAGLTVPESLRLVFLPPYTPELQPAETLWTLVNEPIVNKHIPTIEDLENIIAKRCVDLAAEREAIKGQTGFHWWPKIVNRTDHPETV